jgi:hypothetical protein
MSALVVFIDVLKHVPILMDHTHVDAELAIHWTVTDWDAMVRGLYNDTKGVSSRP